MFSSKDRRSSYWEFSGYVNVCAVACLLLLVGSWSPRSSAAPFKSRSMERQKRASEEENPLWGNPCVYGSTITKTDYEPKFAENLARQAKYVLEETAKYKDEFAKLYSYENFDLLYNQWNNDNDDWLREFPWHLDDVMPKNKILYKSLEEDDLDDLMKHIDDVLPYMYKSLKMIVASFQMFAENLINDNIVPDANLAKNIKDTIPKLSKVLCLFFDVIASRDLKMLPLLDSEIPPINDSNLLKKAYPIYRDTLNYLEYLILVFQKMSKTDLTQSA
ncbi:uncharacterized protein LOC131844991 isoform X2 [Achroia grisella]|uniref:uncharacterized protein LOC131844991 isoform X2 n=1 Tax=Achroia grisella TaxID=688607 RepID=UPI0027D22AC9|nr:uncharacterized protein LOC131844991 isoform X2 [Achroia grisella]